MKKFWIYVFPLALASCGDHPSQSHFPLSEIVAFVHSGDTALADKRIELLQTGETKLTNSQGLAEFAVSPGDYVIRAFDINRGGPTTQYIDFNVQTRLGEITRLDIVDCPDCVGATP